MSRSSPDQTADAIVARLAKRTGGPADYQDSSAWFANFLATCLDPGDRPLLDQLEDGHGGVILMPLRRRRQRFGPFAPICLSSLTNYYTCRYHPLGQLDGQSGFADWGRRLRAGPMRPDYIALDALDTAVCRTIGAGLRQAGYWVEAVARFGNWYLPTSGLGFDAYWAGRPSRLRHTVERKDKRLGRNHRVEVEVLTEKSDRDRAIAVYAEVDGGSWKQPEPYPGFMPGLIAGGLATGQLQVGVLTVDRVPAAVQVWLVADRRATIFKLSYAEAFKADSVGSILTCRLIRRGLEAGGWQEIDFGRGDDPYKQDWLPHRRQRWSLLAYDPLTPLGLMLGVRNLLPVLIRQLQSGGSARAITTPSDETTGPAPGSAR